MDSTGVVPKGSAYLQGAPPETQGAGYPGVKTILKAIKDLEDITGLEAKDRHDRNILIRPETKDIVIVDVGLFKQGPAAKFQRGQPPKYERDVTVMQEVSPEDEHAGHVERSKYQGLRNVKNKLMIW